MLFDRVKPLDAILATAEKKGLHRSLGPFQLTLLGIGAVIGTGIFVLTAEAAQKAGPGMVVSFMVAGFVCAVAALCYSELSSMVPVAGSAYTYTYAVVGEMMAWMVGWALILEYAVGASAVAVGWSNHAMGLLHGLGWDFPIPIKNADALMAKVELLFGASPTPDILEALRVGGWINVPAIIISAAATWLLVIGTTESARVNAVLVLVKIAALTLFLALTLPVLHAENFKPFAPTGARGRAEGQHDAEPVGRDEPPHPRDRRGIAVPLPLAIEAVVLLRRSRLGGQHPDRDRRDEPSPGHRPLPQQSLAQP